MTTHAHQHRTIAFWTLTLPDVYGYHEAFIAWDCPCGDVVWSTGEFAPHATALTPGQWLPVIERERREKSPLAQVAAKEEQVMPFFDIRETPKLLKRKPHAYPPAR